MRRGRTLKYLCKVCLHHLRHPPLRFCPLASRCSDSQHLPPAGSFTALLFSSVHRNERLSWGNPQLQATNGAFFLSLSPCFLLYSPNTLFLLSTLWLEANALFLPHCHLLLSLLLSFHCEVFFFLFHNSKRWMRDKIVTSSGLKCINSCPCMSDRVQRLRSVWFLWGMNVFYAQRRQQETQRIRRNKSLFIIFDKVQHLICFPLGDITP